MSKRVECDVGVEGTTTRRAPKGHFVVYVGTRMTRFVVPTWYLKSAQFKELLDKAAEEFGFDHAHNKIVLPCDESAFLRLASLLNKYYS